MLGLAEILELGELIGLKDYKLKTWAQTKMAQSKQEEPRPSRLVSIRKIITNPLQSELKKKGSETAG